MKLNLPQLNLDINNSFKLKSSLPEDKGGAHSFSDTNSPNLTLRSAEIGQQTISNSLLCTSNTNSGLHLFDVVPTQVVANAVAKFFGGHQLDIIRSEVNAKIVQKSSVNYRTFKRSLTYKGLGANLFRSTLSTGIPGKLFEETYNQTSSTILATSATLGFSTLNALFIETKFATQTPAFRSLNYLSVLNSSGTSLCICYALREAPYLLALVGLTSHTGALEKVVLTSFLAAISFFPDAASRGILNMHLNHSLPTSSYEQIQVPFQQILNNVKQHGFRRVAPGLVTRTVSISLFVHWYTFCLDQINRLKSN
ncbi:MAG: hypothetical protein VXX85_01115 [Candidatus Margulisiibacteriota bacterium]|nr:hypothetical protein [Candidatus Margulisiibacteriota bacterium]